MCFFSFLAFELKEYTVGMLKRSVSNEPLEVPHVMEIIIDIILYKRVTVRVSCCAVHAITSAVR